MRQKLYTAGRKVAVFGLGNSVSYDESYADAAAGELPRCVRESGLPDDRVHEPGGIRVGGVEGRAGRLVLRPAAGCGEKGGADGAAGRRVSREAARVLSRGGRDASPRTGVPMDPLCCS